LEFIAVFERAPEGYIAFVEELPGANTQGDTLEEARENLLEAIQLVLEANRALAEESIRGRNVLKERLTMAPQHQTKRPCQTSLPLDLTVLRP
jgi:predicted RNase H-like HicB family nuclease